MPEVRQQLSGPHDARGFSTGKGLSALWVFSLALRQMPMELFSEEARLGQEVFQAQTGRRIG
jgi:hypothetical protein